MPNPDHAAFAARVESLAKSINTDIWPGYELLADPLLLYFKEDGQSFLIGYPGPLGGFSAVPGAASVYFSTSFSAQINTHFETLHPVGGVPTNIFAVPVGYSVRKELSFIAHEVFHPYQKKNFKHSEFKYCEAGPEALALMYLESYIAAKMLLSPEDTGTARDFLAARRRKYEIAPECVKEDVLEMFEGTARYVEMRSLGAPGAAAAARESLETIRNSNHDPDGARHARGYSTGAAICAVLEKKYRGWQRELEKGRAPGELLEEKLGASRDLAGVYEKYGYEGFFRKAQTDTVAAERGRKELVQRINAYSGYRIRLVPSTGTISMPYTAASTSRAGKYALLEIMNISVSGACEKFKGRDLLLLSDGWPGLVFMPGGSAPDIMADGKSLNGLKDYSGRAAGLQLKGENFSLGINCATEIKIKDREITLEVAKNDR